MATEWRVVVKTVTAGGERWQKSFTKKTREDAVEARDRMRAKNDTPYWRAAEVWVEWREVSDWKLY